MGKRGKDMVSSQPWCTWAVTHNGEGPHQTDAPHQAPWPPDRELSPGSSDLENQQGWCTGVPKCYRKVRFLLDSHAVLAQDPEKKNSNFGRSLVVTHTSRRDIKGMEEQQEEQGAQAPHCATWRGCLPPLPGVCTAKMSPHSIWLCKSAGLPSRRSRGLRKPRFCS